MRHQSPTVEILELKPNSRDAEFVSWMVEARKRISEALAIPPEMTVSLKPAHLASQVFEDSRRNRDKVTVVVGYGVNGALTSSVSNGKLTSSRPIHEDQFFRSPFGTMLMEAQWFWRTHES